MQQQVEELYSRGKYRLEWDARRDGTLRTPFLQIVWYDVDAGRNRSKSTGTADVEAAESALDALFMKKERGQAVCATCGQPLRTAARYLLTDAIADYLVVKEKKPSIGAMRARLAHVSDYLSATDRLDTACDDVDEDWIEEFREWAAEVPVAVGKAGVRDRAPGTIEASVRQLAAAINFAYRPRKNTLFPAAFAPRKPEAVSRSPAYRADIKMLAAMFRFCVDPPDVTPLVTKKSRIIDREQLHRFLQVSVATWCRPDAAYEVSTDRSRDQWHSNARALNLNPRGRTQTKKHRPIVPIGTRMAALLDGHDGFYISVQSIRTAFKVMQGALGLPGDRESGTKLIRRSMAHIAREKLGERDWVEGQIMLGHRKTSTSDVYAPFTPGYLGRALAVTEEIIEQIEKLCPGAFGEPGWHESGDAGDVPEAHTGKSPERARASR